MEKDFSGEKLEKITFSFNHIITLKAKDVNPDSEKKAIDDLISQVKKNVAAMTPEQAKRFVSIEATTIRDFVRKTFCISEGGLTFEEALKELQKAPEGTKKITRASWGSNERYLTKNEKGCIVEHITDKEFSYTPLVDECLADDWYVIKDKK